PRQSHRHRAARPARPRLRPDRGRGVAARAGRARSRLVARARPPSLAPLARGAPLALRAGRSPGGHLAGRRSACSSAGGGERIQAPRPARVALAAGAAAAYGGAGADALVRAPSPVVAFVPGLVLGALLLVVALAWRGRGLGAALFLAGGTYVSAVTAGATG